MRPTRGEIVEYVADALAYCGEGEQPIMEDRVIVALADDLAEARALLADCVPHVQAVHDFLERTK